MPNDLMMSSGQVRTLCNAGMTIGAHTVSHPILCSISDEAARHEMLVSKSRLEEITGKPVGLFAYPNGKPHKDYSRNHVSIAREVGFSAAFSTSAGVATHHSDLFQLPRFTPWDRSAWRYALRMAANLRQTEPVIA
jgi:peptidoglycan/xylan/chitin deacetylase (PgdA/CDA1 family)